MLKSSILYFTLVSYLVIADVQTKISGNEILFLDTGNNLTASSQDSSTYPYAYHNIGDKKVLSIVINPIIHNVAQGYGPGSNMGDKIVEPSTNAPIITTTPSDRPLGEHVFIVLGKIKFLLRFIVSSAATFLRAIIRFVWCTFVPICGLFGIFGDEVVDESIVSPEGVTRGLNFIEDLIAKYHDLHNATTL